jgi:O-antigen/teichoic acid export membrane protein
MVVFAKLGTPRMAGEFTLGLAVTGPVMLFFDLQLRTLQATEVNNKFIFRDYLGLRLVTVTAGITTTCLVIYLFGYKGETAIIIFVLILAKAFDSISDVIYGLLQQREQMDRIAKSMILKGLLSVLFLSGLIYFSNDIVWGIMGLLLAWSLTLILYDIRSAYVVANSINSVDLTISKITPQIAINTIKPQWHLKKITQMVCLAFPLGISMLLVSLNVNIPRYLLELNAGKEQLGIFSSIFYLQAAGTMVVSALGHSFSPRLAKYYASKDKASFCKLVLIMICIAIVLGGVGIFVALTIGEEILSILYTTEYSKYNNVFLLSMIAACFNYISLLLRHAIIACRYLRAQTLSFGLVAVNLTAACLFLIPKYGLYGAAVSYVFSAFLQSLFSMMIILIAIKNKNIEIKV